MTPDKELPDTPAPGDLLFAYGTLQRGGEFHRLLVDSNASFIGPGRLLVSYPLLVARYPCLLDEPGTGHRVRGEVYRIPDAEGWASLDRLEGCPHEYTRRVEKAETDARILEAWTYFYIRDDLDRSRLTPVERFPVR